MPRPRTPELSIRARPCRVEARRTSGTPVGAAAATCSRHPASAGVATRPPSRVRLVIMSGRHRGRRKGSRNHSAIGGVHAVSVLMEVARLDEPGELTDADAISRARAGDLTAYEVLVARYTVPAHRA